MFHSVVVCTGKEPNSFSHRPPGSLYQTLLSEHYKLHEGRIWCRTVALALLICVCIHLFATTALSSSSYWLSSVLSSSCSQPVWLAPSMSRAGQDRDKCSTATGCTSDRDSGTAPRKQLLCYQSHFDHRHGLEWVRFLGSFFMASESVSHYQIIMTRELSSLRYKHAQNVNCAKFMPLSHLNWSLCHIQLTQPTLCVCVYANCEQVNHRSSS